MWLFLPTGLLMPAIVPMDKADVAFTEGKYDLQVRGRLVSHLEDFIKTYMEPGTYHEEIQLNPDMDYNCRFYTTHEAFTKAMSLAIADIDYEKYKPTVELPNKDGSPRKDGKLFHSVNNSIWGTLTRLAPAGGSWAKHYVPSGSRGKYSGYVGSSFGSRDTELESHDWWSKQTDAELATDGFGVDDWTPSREDEISVLLGELEDIPADQWHDNVTGREWDLIKDEARREMRAQRKADKKSRRNNWRRGLVGSKR